MIELKKEKDFSDNELWSLIEKANINNYDTGIALPSSFEDFKFKRNLSKQAVLAENKFPLIITFEGNLIGMIIFDRITDKSLSLTYWIAEEYRGLGFGKQAVVLAVKDFFKKTDVENIQALCKSSNEKSEKILKDIGFKFTCFNQTGLFKILNLKKSNFLKP